MKTTLRKNRCATFLSAFAAGLAGIFAVTSAVATTSTFTNDDPADNNWTTDGNWDEGVPGTNDGADDSAVLNLGAGEALINSDVPDIDWVEIGVGNDDGAVRMVDGGSLTLGGNRFEVGGDAGNQNASFVMEGGSVTAAAGDLWMVGRLAGDTGTSTVTIEGGTFSTRGLSMGREATSSGSATLNVTGGVLEFTGADGRNMWINGVGPSGVNSSVNISGGSVSTPNQVLAGSTGSAGATSIEVTGTGSFSVGTAFHLGTPGEATGGAAVSLLVADDGQLTVGESLNIGHSGGETTVTVTGGTVDVDGVMRLGNKQSGNASTANAFLEITGGSMSIAGGIAGDDRDMDSTANFSLAGDGSFSFGTDGWSFAPGGQTFAIAGSGATFNGASNLHFSDGNIISFTGDAGGFSPVTLQGGDLVIGGDQIELEIDAAEVSLGLYVLFEFDGIGGYAGTDSVFGIENVTLADPGWTYNLQYGEEILALEIIPEPGAYAMIFGALALAGAFILRRRRV